MLLGFILWYFSTKPVPPKMHSCENRDTRRGWRWSIHKIHSNSLSKTKTLHALTWAKTFFCPWNETMNSEKRRYIHSTILHDLVQTKWTEMPAIGSIVTCIQPRNANSTRLSTKMGFADPAPCEPCKCARTNTAARFPGLSQRQHESIGKSHHLRLGKFWACKHWKIKNIYFAIFFGISFSFLCHLFLHLFVISVLRFHFVVIWFCILLSFWFGNTK